jgi:formylglycine-generating enzyme required for sulfatase activity/pimeloyl-ACP methyl ester carboxylesterase
MKFSKKNLLHTVSLMALLFVLYLTIGCGGGGGLIGVGINKLGDNSNNNPNQPATTTIAFTTISQQTVASAESKTISANIAPDKQIDVIIDSGTFSQPANVMIGSVQSQIPDTGNFSKFPQTDVKAYISIDQQINKDITISLPKPSTTNNQEFMVTYYDGKNNIPLFGKEVNGKIQVTLNASDVNYNANPSATKLAPQKFIAPITAFIVVRVIVEVGSEAYLLSSSHNTRPNDLYGYKIDGQVNDSDGWSKISDYNKFANDNKKKILIVHGIFSDYNDFTPLAKYLTANNFEVFAYSYPWLKSMNVNGEKLAEVISKIGNINNKISIVCHSMGGPVSRTALRDTKIFNSQHCACEYVDKLIMCSAVNSGSITTRSISTYLIALGFGVTFDAKIFNFFEGLRQLSLADDAGITFYSGLNTEIINYSKENHNEFADKLKEIEIYGISSLYDEWVDIKSWGIFVPQESWSSIFPLLTISNFKFVNSGREPFIHSGREPYNHRDGSGTWTNGTREGEYKQYYIIENRISNQISLKGQTDDHSASWFQPNSQQKIREFLENPRMIPDSLSLSSTSATINSGQTFNLGGVDEIVKLSDGISYYLYTTSSRFGYTVEWYQNGVKLTNLNVTPSTTTTYTMKCTKYEYYEKSIDFVLTVNTVTNSTIDKATETFDKKTPTDITVNMTLIPGTELSSIKNGSTALTLNTDYTKSGNVVTIKISYLATLSVGTTTLTFDFSIGTDPTLAITVVDNSQPKTLSSIELSKTTDSVQVGATYDLSKILTTAHYSDLTTADKTTKTIWSIVTGGVYIEQSPMQDSAEKSSGVSFAGSISNNFIFNAPSTAGTQKLKASYTEGSATKYAYFTLTITTLPQVAEPTFTPAAGTYTSAQSVTISCTTPGATIRYTLDGTTPSATVGTTYSGPISVSATTTIKAIAIKSGMTDSAIASATYTINISQPTGQTITLDLGGGVTLEMVKIAAAGKSFQMGSPDTEQDRNSDEGPVHTVSFTKDYYMGKYELTQAQWMKIYGSWPGSAPSSTYGVGDDNPAYYVSWNDICGTGGFLEKLNTLKPSGYSGFRLPTEAEWEYAARAGTQTRFYWGDDPSYTLIGSYAWYDSNSGSKTHPVREKLPNSFGLYDMSGNVWEWCSDWYGSYGSSAVSDPAGPTTGSYRVSRGGSWGSYGGGCRSAFRNYYFPSYRFSFYGFRLALPTGQ